jgi:hypothetical protein
MARGSMPQKKVAWGSLALLYQVEVVSTIPYKLRNAFG